MDHRHAGVFAFILLLIPVSTLIVGCPATNPSSPGPSGSAYTATPTFTQACFIGTSPTCTPTFTPTHTLTPCFTWTPTATVAGVNGLTGNTTYTSGIVSTSNPIGIFVSNFNNYFETRWVLANGGAYSFYGMTNGNYYIAVWRNNLGDGTASRQGAHVGDHGMIHNNTCDFGSAVSITINTAVVPLNLSFNNSQPIFGAAGTATYTGAMGPVNPCKMIFLQLYSDPGYTTTVGGNSSVLTNGGHYDLVDFTPGANRICATGTYYVKAWFDSDGDRNGSPETGDPYQNLGAYITTTNPNGLNASFNDTLITP